MNAAISLRAFGDSTSYWLMLANHLALLAVGFAIGFAVAVARRKASR